MSHWNAWIQGGQSSALEEREGWDLLLYFWGFNPFVICSIYLRVGMIHPFHFHILPCSERKRSKNLRIMEDGKSWGWDCRKPLLDHPSPAPLIPHGSLCIWGCKNMEFQQHCPPSSCGTTPSRNISGYGLYLFMLQTANPDIPKILPTRL